MTEERKKLEDHLAALEAFLASDAHAGFVAAREQEISDVKDRILMLPPVNEGNISQSLMAYGEWDCLENMKTTFEVARGILKDRIDEIIERETQTATTTKT